MTSRPGWRAFVAVSCLGTAMVLAALCPLQARAQTHSAFPVDISTGPLPRPVIAAGRSAGPALLDSGQAWSPRSGERRLLFTGRNCPSTTRSSPFL